MASNIITLGAESRDWSNVFNAQSDPRRMSDRAVRLSQGKDGTKKKLQTMFWKSLVNVQNAMFNLNNLSFGKEQLEGFQNRLNNLKANIKGINGRFSGSFIKKSEKPIKVKSALGIRLSKIGDAVDQFLLKVPYVKNVVSSAYPPHTENISKIVHMDLSGLDSPNDENIQNAGKISEISHMNLSELESSTEENIQGSSNHLPNEDNDSITEQNISDFITEGLDSVAGQEVTPITEDNVSEFVSGELNSMGNQSGVSLPSFTPVQGDVSSANNGGEGIGDSKLDVNSINSQQISKEIGAEFSGDDHTKNSEISVASPEKIIDLGDDEYQINSFDTVSGVLPDTKEDLLSKVIPGYPSGSSQDLMAKLSKDQIFSPSVVVDPNSRVAISMPDQNSELGIHNTPFNDENKQYNTASDTGKASDISVSDHVKGILEEFANAKAEAKAAEQGLANSQEELKEVDARVKEGQEKYQRTIKNTLNTLKALKQHIQYTEEQKKEVDQLRSSKEAEALKYDQACDQLSQMFTDSSATYDEISDVATIGASVK